MRMLFALTSALFLSIFPAAPAPPDPPQKLALLIGINQYLTVSNLRGCVNDVDRMKAVLIGKFDFNPADIVVLTDQQATHAGITAALRQLAARAKGPDDVIVVHYSGHGSRMEDESGDEIDGLDETLVPHDRGVNGVRDVRDDEIHAFLRDITARTRNVTLILDSCHSGSATRGGAEGRRAPDDIRPVASPPRARARSAEGANDFRPLDAGYVLISGSRPHELSNEFDVDGQRAGALTYYLTQAMSELPAGATYRDVIERVGEQVTAQFPSQHPDLEGARDRVMFGDAHALPRPYVIVNPRTGGSVSIAAGSLHGLVKGAELDVYPPGSRTFDDSTKRIARVRITTADALEAQADVVDGGPARSASRAVVTSRRYPDQKLRIFFDERQGSMVLPIVRTKLAEYPFAEIVTDEGRADIRLREENGSVFTESADLVPLSAPFEAAEPDAVDRTLKRVNAWGRWFAILRLENRDGGLPVRLTVGNGETRFEHGARVEVVVENQSTSRVYLTLLDLEVDGAISLLGAATDMNDFIPPNGVRRQRIDLIVPDGRVWVPDVIKAIVTTTPLDPAMFTQAAPRLGDATRFSSDPLAAFLQASVAGLSRVARPAPSGDWSAVARRVETHATDRGITANPGGLPDTPRLDSFVMHLAEGARSDAREATRDLPRCGAGPRPDECWEVTPLGPGVSAAELRPAGRRAGSRAARSIGAAWNEAHALRDKTGADVVEPVFEYPAVEEPVRSSGGPSEDPPADHEWSLKYIDAPKAIQFLRTLGKKTGQEADGIILGHPDTGYREHPEIWDADESRSPLLFTKGWNFVESNDRPFDPLADSGIVPNPGHGTKSSSVILSPAGKQWPSSDPNDFVTGVAPGARAVPLRVHTSVVQFNSARLAKAILYAAQPDQVHVRLSRPVDIISIAMGGLPSLALYKAVKLAEQKGVIVIAAAGNQVKYVVWPARFSQTIAVAATNVHCRTWSGSSHGDAVDIAAPGEAVWHASVDGTGTFAIKPGAGTTYATGTTAGTAALWLARHAGSAELDRLRREGGLTSTLRWMLQRTAWKPTDSAKPAGASCDSAATWDGSYGAGIINAAALLQASIEEPPVGRGVSRDISTFPVSASLFDPALQPDDVSRRLGILLRDAAAGEQRQLDVELATLYAIDDTVRGALDPITQPAEPSQSVYDRARRAIIDADASVRLRDAAGARRE